MLPKQFQPTATYDLIRLGRNHDGRYLVDPASVAKTETLISFGLSADWSFEKIFQLNAMFHYWHMTAPLGQNIYFGVSLEISCKSDYESYSSQSAHL